MILYATVALVIAIIIFFKIPYSSVKTQFQKDVQMHVKQSKKDAGIFTEEDIAHLPGSVQKHFKTAGYIGKPKMTSMYAYMKSVPFRESNSKPPMIIDYTLHLFAYKPVRMAYIKTSM